MDTKISTKAVRFGILISAAMISSMSFAARKAVNKAPAAKAHPNVAKVYKPYALYRRYSDPGFHVKNAAEAKKIASELEKFKPTLTKFSEDTKDVRIQNVATSLLSGIDELVAELPSKVIQP